MYGPQQDFLMDTPMVSAGHIRQMICIRGSIQNSLNSVCNVACNGRVILTFRRHFARSILLDESTRDRQIRTHHRQPRMQKVKQLVGQAKPKVVDCRTIEGQTNICCSCATPRRCCRSTEPISGSSWHRTA